MALTRAPRNFWYAQACRMRQPMPAPYGTTFSRKKGLYAYTPIRLHAFRISVPPRMRLSRRFLSLEKSTKPKLGAHLSKDRYEQRICAGRVRTFERKGRRSSENARRNFAYRQARVRCERFRAVWQSPLPACGELRPAFPGLR
jgi:hypothetical protein